MATFRRRSGRVNVLVRQGGKQYSKTFDTKAEVQALGKKPRKRTEGSKKARRLSSDDRRASKDFCNGHAGIQKPGHTDQVTVRACRPPHAMRIASLTRCLISPVACNLVTLAANKGENNVCIGYRLGI